MAKKVATTSKKILEKLDNLSDEQLYNRYLEYADNDEDETEEDFGNELVDTIANKVNGKRVNPTLFSVLDTAFYNVLMNTLYTKTRFAAQKKGHKLKLKDIVADIEKVLSAESDSQWFLDYLALSEKNQDDINQVPQQYIDIVDHICKDLSFRAISEIGAKAGV